MPVRRRRNRSPRFRPLDGLSATILIGALVTTASFLIPGSELLAQGVTTAAIGGSVRATDGTNVDGTRVTVRSGATGFAVEATVRHGRFLVQGLEVGGPYAITLERLGFHPERVDGLYLSLGESLSLEFVMRPSAIALETLRVTVTEPLLRTDASTGTGTTISDSLIRRLPTLNRNLYDFVRLVPQVSTRVGLELGGLSGGGVGARFNDFLINGASERSVSGNLPPTSGGGKSVPLEAVTQYQILLSPYDVRYGDFAGALVNTVTRSGTNEWRGSAFGYWRTDGLGRRGGPAPIPPHERWQYGFSLGGPILHDRLHFFLAPELQHLTSPAPGPYMGQPAGETPPLPLRGADLQRLDEIMRGYGLVAGSGGPLENANPLRNAFGRLDLAVPEWSSRAVIWQNYSRTTWDQDIPRDQETFALSTYRRTQEVETWTAALQLHTTLGRSGGHHELLVSHRAGGLESSAEVRQPIVRVAVPGTAGGRVTVITGTHEAAQGGSFDDRKLDIRDELTLPLGASHVATFGLEAHRYRAHRRIVNGSYGTWTFASLDSLERGIADRFEIRRDLGSGTVPIRGGQYALYAGDEWRPRERLSVTVGLRAEVLDIDDRAPYNPAVDSIFRRRTDRIPRPRPHLSPRLGFRWDLAGTGRDRLRGGAGIFTGRPPLGWLNTALTSHGSGVGVLRCGSRPTDSGPPPPFVPDFRLAPTACSEGPDVTASPRGEVDVLDPQLGMARTLRISLAYDRGLPWNLFATGEALVTRNLTDFVFVNLNLEGPRGMDRHGRVLYGDLRATGQADPALRSDFAEVIDLRSTSRNHSYQLSARLEKRLPRGTVSASYTYSRVRDVQTPLRVNVPGTVNWSSRVVSGRHEELIAGISGNDIPHRLILAGTFTAPWERWSTVLSFYYVGESGAPFTYRASGVGGRGDLNADGSNLNDPIYVPRDALDPDEIAFSGVSSESGADNSPSAQVERVSRQRTAFERFIDRTPCLRRQRGRILGRNGCREPWAHTSILSVRQPIPFAAGALEAELDVFNVLNLLDAGWGLFRVADPALLEHVGQTLGTPETAQPIFRLNSGATEWTTLPTESAFQLQLGLRYRF